MFRSQREGLACVLHAQQGLIVCSSCFVRAANDTLKKGGYTPRVNSRDAALTSTTGAGLSAAFAGFFVSFFADAVGAAAVDDFDFAAERERGGGEGRGW